MLIWRKEWKKVLQSQHGTWNMECDVGKNNNKV